MSSSPVEGEIGADRLGPFRLRFDRRLAPTSVHRGSVTLKSGAVSVFLSVRYDPVTEEIIAVPFSGTPLVASVEYELRVQGARDLDGVAVEAVGLSFVTGTRAQGDYGVGTTGWETAGPLLAERCAQAACHAADQPALGLDLSSGEAVLRTALGVAAVQTGESRFPDRGLQGLPIIDVLAGGGRPSTSYLIYKMLGDEHIQGDPMPVEPRLEDVVTIADWILAGAPTE